MDPNIIIASILIFIGAFIQTTTGFGMAIVVSPVLILIAPDFIPGPMIIVGLFLSSINAIKYRDHISLARLKNAFVGLIPGIISGALLLYFIDARFQIISATFMERCRRGSQLLKVVRSSRQRNKQYYHELSTVDRGQKIPDFSSFGTGNFGF
ncbi:sulfite exporter TauE/SafE family protein [Vibrio breoganii]